MLDTWYQSATKNALLDVVATYGPESALSETLRADLDLAHERAKARVRHPDMSIYVLRTRDRAGAEWETEHDPVMTPARTKRVRRPNICQRLRFEQIFICQYISAMTARLRPKTLNVGSGISPALQLDADIGAKLIEQLFVRVQDGADG